MYEAVCVCREAAGCHAKRHVRAPTSGRVQAWHHAGCTVCPHVHHNASKRGNQIDQISAGIRRRGTSGCAGRQARSQQQACRLRFTACPSGSRFEAACASQRARRLQHGHQLALVLQGRHSRAVVAAAHVLLSNPDVGDAGAAGHPGAGSGCAAGQYQGGARCSTGLWRGGSTAPTLAHGSSAQLTAGGESAQTMPSASSLTKHGNLLQSCKAHLHHPSQISHLASSARMALPSGRWSSSSATYLAPAGTARKNVKRASCSSRSSRVRCSAPYLAHAATVGQACLPPAHPTDTHTLLHTNRYQQPRACGIQHGLCILAEGAARPGEHHALHGGAPSPGSQAASAGLRVVLMRRPSRTNGSMQG